MDVDLDRPLGEDEHMEYDDLPSVSQPVGSDDQVADHDGDALMDDGEVGVGEEEMEAEPTPPLGDTGPGPGLSFPDSGSGSGPGVGFVATEQAGLIAPPSGPQPEDTGVGRKDGETREEDMTPAEDREGREGGEAGAVKPPLTDLPQENVQIVSEHVGGNKEPGAELGGEGALGVNLPPLTDSGEMATTAQATTSADEPGEASQSITSGVANASVLPHTNGHAKAAAGNGQERHAEDEVEGEDEEYYEEDLEERGEPHDGHEPADGDGENQEHMVEEEDEEGDEGGDYSALSELALDVHSLPPIIIHLPDLGARALFAPLPPNEVDAGGKVLSLPVWLKGRQEELGEASLTDVLAAIHAAVIREGLNQSGEMVIAEHSMDLKMGEDDVNLQSITFLEFISAYLECDLPEPVQLHMHFEPSRFIARYNAILVALGHKAADAEVSVEETKVGQTASPAQPAQPVSSVQGKGLAPTPREAQSDAAVTGKSAPLAPVTAEAETEGENEDYEVEHETEAGREIRQEHLQSVVREEPRDKQRHHDAQAQYGESRKEGVGSAFPIATAASAKYTEPLRPAYVGSPRYITSPARDHAVEPTDAQHEIVERIPPRSAGGRRDGEPNDTTDESFVESSEPAYQGLVPEPASHEIVLAADSAESAEPAEEDYEGGEENQTEFAGDQGSEEPNAPPSAAEGAMPSPPISAAPSTADLSIAPPREDVARLAKPREAPQPIAAITPGLTATGVFLDQQPGEGSAAQSDYEQIVEDVQNEPEVSAPTEEAGEAGDAGELKEEPEPAEAGFVVNEGHEEVEGEQEEQGDEQEAYEEGQEEEGEEEYEEYEEEAEGEEDEGEFDVDEFVAAEDRKVGQAEVVEGETAETAEAAETEPAGEAEEPEVEVTVTESAAPHAPEPAGGGIVPAQLTEVAEEVAEAAETAEGSDVLPSNEADVGGSTESSTIQDESPEDAEEVDEEEEYEEDDEAYDEEEEYDDAEGEEYEDQDQDQIEDEDEGGDQDEEPEQPLTASSVPEKRSVEEDDEGVDEREAKRSKGAD